MKTKITKIVLAGEGGQGVQTIAKVLSEALVVAGLEVIYIPQFGPEQRGTPTVAYIQFSKEPIAYPHFDTADIILVLRKRALKIVEKHIGKNTDILFDSSTIPRKIIQQNNSHVWGIPATKVAEDDFIPKTVNLVALGAIANKFLDYPENALWEIVQGQLSKKFKSNESLAIKSKAAFNFGYSFKLENKNYSIATHDIASGIVVKKNNLRTAVIVPKYCKGCGICVLKCPVKALSFGKTLGVYGTPTPDIDIEKCITCGNCFRFCPDSAIKVEKNN